jgi:uncharacterized membrane protein YfcA
LCCWYFAAVYTLETQNFGLEHAGQHTGHRELVYALLLGGVIGFYDGFFGPGNRQFSDLSLLCDFFGFDFLHASASAKVVNVATNLAALAYFVPNGYVLPLLAVGMALANVGGSLAGVWLALKHGSGFVRQVFSSMLVY